MGNHQKTYDLAKSYDRFAKWFQILEKAYYDPEQTGSIARLIETTLDQSSCSILDCACGVGSAAMDLAAGGFRVTCSDVSSEMLRYSRENAGSKGIDSVEFYQCDWRDLPEGVPGVFDCVLNLGINIYHLRDEELWKAISGMASKLRPGGLLLLDNKRWQEFQVVIDGRTEVYLTERRETIRVFNPARPLPEDAFEKFFFFDIVWSERDEYVMHEVRVSAEKILNLLDSKDSALLNIAGYPVDVSMHNGSLVLAYHPEYANRPADFVPYEAIPIKGWPVSSVTVGKLMEDAGLRDIKIVDKYAALHGDLKPQKMGKYDLIIAKL